MNLVIGGNLSGMFFFFSVYLGRVGRILLQEERPEAWQGGEAPEGKKRSKPKFAYNPQIPTDPEASVSYEVIS